MLGNIKEVCRRLKKKCRGLKKTSKSKKYWKNIKVWKVEKFSIEAEAPF